MSKEDAIKILNNALSLSKKTGNYVLEEWDEEAIKTLIQTVIKTYDKIIKEDL